MSVIVGSGWGNLLCDANAVSVLWGKQVGHEGMPVRHRTSTVPAAGVLGSFSGSAFALR
jgi:hypothetical protein